MKDKILAALKLKFTGVSDATLTRIAEKKAGSVTTEDQIQSIVDGVTFDIVVQSEVDSRIANANKITVQNFMEKHKLKEKDGKIIVEETLPTDPPKPPQSQDESPLLKEINELKNKVNGFEIQERKKVFGDKLRSQLKEKKIPALLADGYDIEKEEDIPKVLEQIEADHNTIKQEYINNGLVTEVPADGVPKGNEASVKADIQRLAKTF
jgi:hypothetical protein